MNLSNTFKIRGSNNEKIIIDHDYELDGLAVMEETDETLSLQVYFDLAIYPDFHEYCSDKVMDHENVWLTYNEKELEVILTGCSFTLGFISYDDDEEIESIDTNATGVLEFKKIVG